MGKISETEKEIRRRRVKDALAFSTLDAPEPSDVAKGLQERYIQGEIEVEDIIEELKKIYSAEGKDSI